MAKLCRTCPRHSMSTGVLPRVNICLRTKEFIDTTFWSVVDNVEDPANLSGSDDEFKHRLGNNEWLEIKKDSLCACATVHLVNIALY